MSDHGNKSEHSFQAGDWVGVRGMGGVGRVVSIDPRRRRARVQLGDQEWELDAGRLERAEPVVKSPRDRFVRVVGRNAAEHEVDLHGMRVEEALEFAERGLDQAIVHHLDRFKIIHGHGSGRLRIAIRQMLERHPYVEHFYFGEPHEGGLACTVVRLRTQKL